MAIDIQIPDSLVGTLKKGFETYLAKTDKEIAEANANLNRLMQRKADLNSVIEQINKTKGLYKSLKHSDYNNLWKWSEKVKFILEQVGKPVSSGNIIEYITAKEPIYRNDETKKKTLAQMISRELSKHKQNVDYYLAGTNNSNRPLYGLLEWKNKKTA